MDGSISINDLIFLDESGAKLGMSSDYARAEGGERAVVKEPRNQGENISLVGAMGLFGVVAMMYCIGSVDSTAFLCFVEKFLVPNIKKGQIVIMDNISFHYAKTVKEAIESVGARVVFLPQYSPDLSPIENLWSKLKGYLKSKSPKSLEDFHITLAEGLDSISSYDCEGWFEHCGYM